MLDELAGFFYLRHGQRKIDALALSAPDDDPGGSQHRGVLREVGLRDSQFFLNFGCRPVTFAQQIEDVETSGVCERFADQHLSIKDLVLQFRLLASLLHHESIALGNELLSRNRSRHHVISYSRKSSRIPNGHQSGASCWVYPHWHPPALYCIALICPAKTKM